FLFQAEDGIRYPLVTGFQTCALPIFLRSYKLLEIERPAYGAPASCHREVPEGRLVERRADASGARALLDVLRPLRLTRFSQQGRSEERRVGKGWRWGGWGEACRGERV